MKRINLTILIPALLALIFFVGTSCLRQVDQSPNPNGAILETPDISPTTENNQNNSGSTKTPVPTLTSHTIVTKSRTPIPSISKADIKEALFVNDNCVLPCVFGLVPGKSLNTVSGNKWFSNGPDSEDGFTYSVNRLGEFRGISIKIYDENTMERLFFSFEEVKDNDKLYIDNIVFGINKIDIRDESLGEWLYDDESFFDAIGYFTSSNILNIYGEPSKIVVKIEKYNIPSNEKLTGITTVGYFYEKYQFYVEYYFPLESENNKLNLCPDFGFVRLLSWNSGDKSMNSFFTNSHIGSYLYIDSYDEITEVVDLSADQYYSLMTDSEFRQCIVVDLRVDD